MTGPRIIKIERRFDVPGGGRMTRPEKAKPQIVLDLEKRKKMKRLRLRRPAGAAPKK